MARILVVDDSPSQQMGMKRIVEKLGHEALTAEDGVSGRVDAVLDPSLVRTVIREWDVRGKWNGWWCCFNQSRVSRPRRAAAAAAPRRCRPRAPG